MIKKVAFTMYPVKDMDRARGFYEKTLGLKVGSNHENAWVEYDIPGGGCLALTTMVKELTPSLHSGGSIAFEVENVDTLTNHIRTEGFPIKVEPFSTAVCRMSVVVDSEGNALMLHQLTKK